MGIGGTHGQTHTHTIYPHGTIKSNRGTLYHRFLSKAEQYKALTNHEAHNDTRAIFIESIYRLCQLPLSFQRNKVKLCELTL